MQVSLEIDLKNFQMDHVNTFSIYTFTMSHLLF